jgi:hypothetical protein
MPDGVARETPAARRQPRALFIQGYRNRVQISGEKPMLAKFSHCDSNVFSVKTILESN